MKKIIVGYKDKEGKEHDVKWFNLSQVQKSMDYYSVLLVNRRCVFSRIEEV